jgi:hypothetical protein
VEPEDKSFALTSEDKAIAQWIAIAAGKGEDPEVFLRWLPGGDSEAAKARRWEIVTLARDILARVHERFEAGKVAL